ncbi:MAG TPA: 50S ribosomal protein L23 [Elusimicrobiales bacterium]|nr:50S ribosomal protein L23 [Elusimicrobiales bacterium]
MTRNVSGILISPILSEKSVAQKDEENRYTFRVAAAANKTEIRKAVESLFKVKVSAVNTVSVRGKFHRVGRHEGRRSDWKKAIVTVRQGQKIDVTDLPK